MLKMLRKKKPLTLASVGKKVLFKIRKESERHLVGELNLKSVYQVYTVKADYGRSVRVADMAGLTIEGTTKTYANATIANVRIEDAKLIEVYPLCQTD